MERKIHMDTVWDKMKSGAWYDAEDESLRTLRAQCRCKRPQFNAMPWRVHQKAIGILDELADAPGRIQCHTPISL